VEAIRPPVSWKGDQDQAEADVVVAVRRVVVVAVRNAAVLRVIVPVAAAKNAVVALWANDR